MNFTKQFPPDTTGTFYNPEDNINSLYDGIEICLPRPQGYDPIRDIPNLTPKKDRTDYNRAFTVQVGYLENILVKASKWEIILKGSPVTFKFGRNDFHLNRTELIQVLEHWGELTGLPIWSGAVKRLEVGLTIETEWPVERYLSEVSNQFAGEQALWMKDGCLETARHKVTTRQFVLYDKVADLRKKAAKKARKGRKAVALDDLTSPLIRVEWRINKYLPRTFKRTLVTVEDLVDPGFMAAVFLKFQERVSKLRVAAQMQTPPEVLAGLGRNDLKLYREIMAEGGLEEYLLTLNREIQQKKRSRSGFYPARSRATQLWEQLIALGPNESPLLNLKKEIASLTLHSKLRRKPQEDK